MDKIAIIVARYGININGGAEMHARMLAEHLNGKYEVNVITTCAKDNTTWNNHYKVGEEVINDIKVIRFESQKKNKRKERKLASYLRRNQRYQHQQINYKNFFYLSFLKSIYRRRENYNQIFDEWIRQQGPYCPSLVDYIGDNRGNYAAFIFFTYLYYPTYFGIQDLRDKSILIPTVHDESPFYFDGMAKLFSVPAYLMYNTLSEKGLVESVYPLRQRIFNLILPEWVLISLRSVQQT